MLWILALVIGALAGLVVVGFILLTERLGARLYPVGSAAWRRVLIPIIGSATICYIVYRYFPDARGSGVMATKAAIFARDGMITAKTTLGKFFCTTATLASGIPLGPEGPSVQVGAGVASVLTRHLGLTSAQVKALVPAGAAAAIAAAFNTPLAAVVFALEEIVGDRNRGARSGRRARFRRFHSAAFASAPTVFEAAAMEHLAATDSRRLGGRTDGVEGAAGSRRRLQLRW
jgi:CIC family chloride channel protein